MGSGSSQESDYGQSILAGKLNRWIDWRPLTRHERILLKGLFKTSSKHAKRKDANSSILDIGEQSVSDGLDDKDEEKKRANKSRRKAKAKEEK